jgi:hypothetical protein
MLYVIGALFTPLDQTDEASRLLSEMNSSLYLSRRKMKACLPPACQCSLSSDASALVIYVMT